MTPSAPVSDTTPPLQPGRGDLPRTFSDRDALVRELAARFPRAEGGASTIRGDPSRRWQPWRPWILCATPPAATTWMEP
ncbi:hypothetical protein AAJV73_04505 [Cyanobium sp. BSA11S]|uniref:hypothetical protein n=1 Tax=Cyanobium sp. BSA11S TaxID=3108224 RepID=UPI003D814702